MEISTFGKNALKLCNLKTPLGKKTPGCSRPQGKTKTTKTTSTGGEMFYVSYKMAVSTNECTSPRPHTNSKLLLFLIRHYL
jgi:hypothetical protein